MVYFHSPIPVEQHIAMARTLNSPDPYLKLKQINQIYKNRKSANSQSHLNFPACDQSRTAVVDVVIMIAVLSAFGFLIYPYARIAVHKTFEFGDEVLDVVREEFLRAPMIYGCLALSIFFAGIALVAITICTSRGCGKPGCRGLRKAAEFDIQLETEECVKNSSLVTRNGVKKGLFELPRDHHRELEAELKKMAPPNGRAVLVFRARCGCSVGRMEVAGPRKNRKVKK